MKKIFYLMSLCLCMFAGVALMTSCGDDDDIDPDDVEIKSGITDKGNQLIMSTKVPSYSLTATATFDGNTDDALCIKFISKETYSSSAAADYVWDEYKKHSDYAEDIAAGLLKKDGKSIIYDETEDFKGETKAQIRTYMERIKAEYDAWNNN